MCVHIFSKFNMALRMNLVFCLVERIGLIQLNLKKFDLTVVILFSKVSLIK